MEQKTVYIPNINCGHCTATIARELENMDGVVKAEGDPASKEVEIEWEEPAVWEQILTKLHNIGFPAKEK